MRLHVNVSVVQEQKDPYNDSNHLRTAWLHNATAAARLVTARNDPFLRAAYSLYTDVTTHQQPIRSAQGMSCDYMNCVMRFPPCFTKSVRSVGAASQAQAR